MPGEFQASLPGLSGQKLRVVLWDGQGRVYNTAGAAFETWNLANIADYDIALTEQGTSGHFVGSMPSVAAGVYPFEVRWPADQTDPVVLAVTDPVVWTGDVQWSGTAALGLNDVPSAVDAAITASHGEGSYSSGSTLGSGALEYMPSAVVDENDDPVDSAALWITDDQDPQSTVRAGTVYTLASGLIPEAFQLDAGTYHLQVGISRYRHRTVRIEWDEDEEEWTETLL